MAHSTRIGGYLRRPTAYPWRDPVQRSSPEPTHSSTVSDGEKTVLVLIAMGREAASLWGFIHSGTPARVVTPYLTSTQGDRDYLAREL